MECVKCKKSLEKESKFCSNCGFKVMHNHSNKHKTEKKIKIFSDSSLLGSNPKKVMQELNDYLKTLDDVKDVRVKHNVSMGHVKNLEVTTFHNEEFRNKFVFAVDVQTHSIGGIFAFKDRGKEDDYLQKWVQNNPNKELTYCFNVYDYGKLREQWFYHRKVIS